MNILDSVDKCNINDLPTLGRLFGQSGAKNFAEKIENLPFVTRHNNSSTLSLLLGVDDIDRFFSTIKYRTTECFCVNGNNPVDVSEFAHRGVVDSRKALRLYFHGSSIILNRVHQYHKPLGDLCLSLSNELSAPCQANVYLTPPNAQGFKTHYDTHDTIIVQTSGTKTWRIYRPALELPLAGQGSDAEIRETGNPTLTVDLNVGEVLYIPRGWIHEAMTTASHSLHVTLGVYFFTWADAILEYVSHCVLTDSTYRKAIPFWKAGSRTGSGFQEQFRALLSNIAERADVRLSLDSLLSQLEEQNMPNTFGLLSQISNLDQLNEESVVRGRPGRVTSISEVDGVIDVRITGGTLKFGSGAREIIEICRSGKVSRISELRTPLSSREKYDVIGRLVAFEALDILNPHPISSNGT